MTERRLVLIEWIDSCSVQAAGRWVGASDLDNLQLGACRSVGWVYRDTETDIVIYSHDGGEDLGGEICIPKVCIKSIREIEA